MLKVFMRLLGAHAGEAPSGGHRSTLQTAPALCQYQDTRQARSGGSRARQPADNLAPSLLLVNPGQASEPNLCLHLIQVIRAADRIM